MKRTGRCIVPAAEPRQSPEELARLGAEVYDCHVRPLLGPDDDDKFVAVDVETGDYELDEDDYAAVIRLRTRRPSAEIWLERVGHAAPYSMKQCTKSAR
jgi:hypothetical protein